MWNVLSSPRLRVFSCLVVQFINALAFGRQCIPPSSVARRLNTPGIRPPRSLLVRPLDVLDTSPYL